ncbi:outer membrane protein assembly factor BamE [Trinickia violacea]|uniref:outer membrane protein assembly factor BamE n=1 Tax=Trinickia violacea TaxID=2571746 RepID=UPI0020C82ED1|nr:outer membrane protein assembly factor BamE [Trinickia violacea]
MKEASKLFALLGTTVCVASCGMVPMTAPDGSVIFPDRSSAWLKEGTFVNVDNLRQMAPGLTKDQVYALLQEPHFNEGVIAVRVWNYIFDFRTADSNAFVSCQYQVRYDGHGRVTATYWKEPDCVRFLNPSIARSVPFVPAAQPIALDASVLFALNKSALEDLRPEDRAKFD